MKRVFVHIDALALSGFEAGERAAFADALRHRLALQFAQEAGVRELIERGDESRPRISNLRIVRGTSVAATAARTADAIGRQVKR